MPCGFPYGGFAYLVEEHQSNKQQDEAAENAARDEDAKLNSPWWQIHLDELTESIEQEHSADRAYKTQLLEKIESLCESPHKDDWPKRFMRAQVITNIFWQLRYAFNVPIYESRLLQIYFNIFSFRMGFCSSDEPAFDRCRLSWCSDADIFHCIWSHVPATQLPFLCQSGSLLPSADSDGRL